MPLVCKPIAIVERHTSEHITELQEQISLPNSDRSMVRNILKILTFCSLLYGILIGELKSYANSNYLPTHKRILDQLKGENFFEALRVTAPHSWHLRIRVL